MLKFDHTPKTKKAWSYRTQKKSCRYLLPFKHNARTRQTGRQTDRQTTEQ